MHSQFTSLGNVYCLNIWQLGSHFLIVCMHDAFQFVYFLHAISNIIFKLSNLIDSSNQHVLHFFSVCPLIFILFLSLILICFYQYLWLFDTVSILHWFTKLDGKLFYNMLLGLQSFTHIFKFFSYWFYFIILWFLCIMEIII